MADPATNTTYPAQLDPLPQVNANDRQNDPGLEHDVVHDRANAVLNALMALIGTTEDTHPATLLGRLGAVETSTGSAGERIVTASTHTLELIDAFAMICMVSAESNLIIIPKSSDVPFPPGTRIDISWDGVGQTVISAADPSIVINTPESLKLRKRFAKATLIRRGAADTWDLEGNLEAAT